MLKGNISPGCLATPVTEAYAGGDLWGSAQLVIGVGLVPKQFSVHETARKPSILLTLTYQSYDKDVWLITTHHKSRQNTGK